jgi:hypothetical protein
MRRVHPPKSRQLLPPLRTKYSRLACFADDVPEMVFQIHGGKITELRVSGKRFSQGSAQLAQTLPAEKHPAGKMRSLLNGELGWRQHDSEHEDR